MRGILIVIISLCAGSVYAGGVEPPRYAYTMTSNHYTVAKFDRIVANGYFNLKLIPKAAGKAKVTALSYEQAPISVAIHNKTLYLTSNPSMYLHYKVHPKVEVWLPSLSELVVKGPVNVNANHINTKAMQIDSVGYGNINIKNINNIRTIKQSGNNKLRIQNIRTHLLVLNLTGFGKLYLQGETNQLFARLNGSALLKARKLAATNIMIQAKHNSEAYVYPLKSIRAFSTGSGEIFYYKHLSDLTRYTVQSGNALQMAW